MKFGFFCLFEKFTGSVHESIENQLKLVELADAMHFDEIWFGEHHFNSFSFCPSPALLLASAAHRTKYARLGCAGFLAPFYDPIRLAEEISMLDHLSNGRLNVGFAKGAFAPDSKHFQVTTEQLRPLMFESVSVIEKLLHVKEPLDFDGDFFHFSNVDIEPKLLSQKLPFYIATFASDETIEFAAKHGYGLLLSQGIDLDECERVMMYYRDIAGVLPNIVLLRTFLIADDAKHAQLLARPLIDHFAKSMRAASSFQKAPIFNKEKYTALVNERATFFDGEKIFQNGIIGDAKLCIEQILTIKKRFANVSVALKPLGIDLFESVKQLKQFNEKVRPYC